MRAKGLRKGIQVLGIEIPKILIPAEAEHLGPDEPIHNSDNIKMLGFAGKI